MLKINKKKAFTLIELVIAITILSIVMLSIFIIYFNIIASNKKLELTRILQENSRNITENIAKDIREKGINYLFYTFPNEKLNYSGSGNSLLAINGGNNYCLIDKTTQNCSENCYKNKDCYIGKYNNSLVKMISDDRVIINKLRFYISGKGDDITNSDREGKVTIIFELGIMPGKGIDTDLAKVTKLNIETTISEKIYKK